MFTIFLMNQILLLFILCNFNNSYIVSFIYLHRTAVIYVRMKDSFALSYLDKFVFPNPISCWPFFFGWIPLCTFPAFCFGDLHQYPVFIDTDYYVTSVCIYWIYIFLLYRFHGQGIRVGLLLILVSFPIKQPWHTM